LKQKLRTAGVSFVTRGILPSICVLGLSIMLASSSASAWLSFAQMVVVNYGVARNGVIVLLKNAMSLLNLLVKRIMLVNSADTICQELSQLEPDISPWLTDSLINYHVPRTPPGKKFGFVFHPHPWLLCL
jgi:hypothetical protein